MTTKTVFTPYEVSQLQDLILNLRYICEDNEDLEVEIGEEVYQAGRILDLFGPDADDVA